MIRPAEQSVELHSKQYRFFKKNPSVQSPLNPRRRVLLGLHGDSTEGFLLKNLYCVVREKIILVFSSVVRKLIQGRISELQLALTAASHTVANPLAIQ